MLDSLSGFFYSLYTRSVRYDKILVPIILKLPAKFAQTVPTNRLTRQMVSRRLLAPRTLNPSRGCTICRVFLSSTSMAVRAWTINYLPVVVEFRYFIVACVGYWYLHAVIYRYLYMSIIMQYRSPQIYCIL